MVQPRETMTLFWVLVCLSCSGSQSNPVPPLAPPPAGETVATLAGPLCEFGGCKCREDAGEPEQEAPEGFKRYEVRLGPTDNPLWASIGDMLFYKSNERAMECFYVDLPPGRHATRLRASRETGFGARLRISELAPENQGWYSTFDFACGGPGLCERAAMEEWKQSLTRYKKNAHDPCGSTKIREVVWQTGRLPDGVPPADLQVDFVLDIYKFTPTFGPGAPECASEK